MAPSSTSHRPIIDAAGRKRRNVTGPMRPKRLALPTLAVLAAAICTACASRGPVALSSQFDPAGLHFSEPRDLGGPLCRIHIADVDDERADKQAMGEIGGRPVHAADTAAWLRSAFSSLSRDHRFAIVEAPETTNVTLSAHLLKAYVMTQNMTKSATVVVRVRYEGATNGADEQIYRGIDNGVNWVGGTGETQSAFDASLAQILSQVDHDLLARCASARNPQG